MQTQAYSSAINAAQVTGACPSSRASDASYSTASPHTTASTANEIGAG